MHKLFQERDEKMLSLFQCTLIFFDSQTEKIKPYSSDQSIVWSFILFFSSCKCSACVVFNFFFVLLFVIYFTLCAHRYQHERSKNMLFTVDSLKWEQWLVLLLSLQFDRTTLLSRLDFFPSLCWTKRERFVLGFVLILEQFTRSPQ